ncbi:hypothetical protein [Cyanothece sp. BG0011]|uniref:hypothetical protein n=1 Tax=Cyanothece sp. BG0011 TaxID=2082950 RepID=UPI000D1EDA02|nr:hypothetical protein [Cyanothece sp. BG0011]
MAEQKEPSQNPPNFQSTIIGLKTVLSIHSKVRVLIIDYSLGAAVIGSIPPFPWLLELKLIALIILNGKMIRDIGAEWRYLKGQNVVTIIFSILGFLGALGTMLMSYIIIYALGLFFIPIITSWATSASYLMFTLTVGRITDLYYLNAQRIHEQSLRRAWHQLPLSKEHQK